MLSIILILISLLSITAIPQPEPEPLKLDQNMWYQKQMYNAWETLGKNVSCYICAAPWPVLDVIPIPYKTDACHKTTEPVKTPVEKPQTATRCAIAVMTALSVLMKWHDVDDI